MVIVTELLPLNDLLLNDLGHLDRHSVDTLGISLDVPLLLLLVSSWAEDVADVLSGLNRVLLILSLSEFEFLLEVAILHLHRILQVMIHPARRKEYQHLNSLRKKILKMLRS